MCKFSVDDELIMHSPHTNEDTRVVFRGKLWDGKAVVFNKVTGWQGAVPMEWLRKDEEN